MGPQWASHHNQHEKRPSAPTQTVRFVSIAAFEGEFRALWSDGRGKILLAIAAGWGLTVGVRTIYPVMLPHLRESYGLDLTSAGVLLSVLFVAYALGQLPGGVLADRLGERRTLTLSLVLSAGALVVVSVANSSAVLYVATAVFGFGVGFYAIARYTAIVTVYPERYGTAVGITNAAPELGQAALPPIAGSIAVLVGWRYGFGLAIPLFVLVAVALWIVLPSQSRTERRAAGTGSLEGARHVLSAVRTPRVVLATLVLIVGITVWQAFTGFYPTYLIEEKGVSPPVASALFGLYFASTAFVHPISGAVYDRLTVRHTFLVVAVSVFALLALPFVDRLWLLVVVSILLGTFLGFETSTESYLVDALPADIEGTGFGVLRTVVFAIGATSPIFFGAVADWGYFDELFLVLAALTFVMIVIATRLPVVQGT